MPKTKTRRGRHVRRNNSYFVIYGHALNRVSCYAGVHGTARFCAVLGRSVVATQITCTTKLCRFECTLADFLRDTSFLASTVQRTKLCRREVNRESMLMAQNMNAGVKGRSRSVERAQRIMRRQFRTAEFRALYCTCAAMLCMTCVPAYA
ncbi:hypothetical protein EVAR_46952_1 [Eumeta japonica]|uniref:Uncharacterized protein n=1 Tax=Eumeta variegata TaxID=151549 RepID=A0A4C1YM46_EUMVA|nr:hypothetical protein EVAR_46952_1 [Eumeta japonica]